MSLCPIVVRPLIYVLELEPVAGAAYTARYVGTTLHLNARWAQHLNETHNAKSGAKFCRQNKAIRIVEVNATMCDTAEQVLAQENEKTIEIMKQYIHKYGPDGWRSVRGGSHCALELRMPRELLTASSRGAVSQCGPWRPQPCAHRLSAAAVVGPSKPACSNGVQRYSPEPRRCCGSPSRACSTSSH